MITGNDGICVRGENISQYKMTDEIHEQFMQSPDYRKAYDEEIRREKLQKLPESWRQTAGIIRTEVARRMGISQPAVSKIECNASRASINTLYRYAQACGVKLQISL